MNKFTEGEDIVCVDENFPHIKKYGGVEKSTITPKKERF